MRCTLGRKRILFTILFTRGTLFSFKKSFFVLPQLKLKLPRSRHKNLQKVFRLHKLGKNYQVEIEIADSKRNCHKC